MKIRRDASGRAHIRSANPRTRGLRDAMPRSASARFGAEVLLVFVRDILEIIGIGRIGLLSCNIRPSRRVFAVEFEPSLGRRLAVRNDRFYRAFRLTHAAIDAFVGMDHQHVLPLVEAVDRADLYAIHIFATDAGFGDNIGHGLRLLSSTCGIRASDGLSRLVET
jgi:hypothetical protein